MKITTTLATCRTKDGSVLVLQEHDGQHYLRVDGVQLMSTTASSSEQQMAEHWHTRRTRCGCGF